jgi:hypothetical protein
LNVNVAIVVPTSADTVTAPRTFEKSADGIDDVAHSRVVYEVHAVVKQSAIDGSELWDCAVAVKSATPKLTPSIVTVAPPDEGVLPRPFERAGASKVKLLAVSVPTTPPTETATYAAFKIESVDRETHVRVVAELQPAVEHALKAELRPKNATVPVRSAVFKLSPEIVNHAPPVDTALTGAANETTGASKVSATELGRPFPDVPTRAATVTCITPSKLLVSDCWTETVVAEVHVVVIMALPFRLPIVVEVVRSIYPKSRPEIVTTPVADWAWFTLKYEVMTGASYVKRRELVPVTALTVTAASRCLPCRAT